MPKPYNLDTTNLMDSPTQIDEPIGLFAEMGSPIADEPPSLANRLVERVARTPGRLPSPQPAHFSIVPKNGNGNGNGHGHRVLRSATVGYVAPEFKGKKQQMASGKMRSRLPNKYIAIKGPIN